MTIFPKTPRFAPEKGSEVPSPGRYNPLLHDPSQDPWRKGPLEIYKAPRSRDPEPGPDTFGLYNPDHVHDNIPGSRPRPRALSTLATPSKHHKELLRLESKLSERDSNINHLAETLHKSEKTMKEVKNALNKSENDNASLQAEVEKLRRQLQGVAGLHTKVLQLESEHDKSKKRRDDEISHLKSELRLAEDRASQYLKQKKTLEGDFMRFQTSVEDSEQSLQSMSQRNQRELAEYLQKVFNDRHASNRALQVTKSLSLLGDVYTKKAFADRASQVNELISLINQANSREDLLYEVLDDLLETNDMQTELSGELVMDLQSERDELRNWATELQAEMQSRQQLSDQLLHEKDIELGLAHQRAAQIEIELSDARLVSSSLENSLMDATKAYNDLANIYHSQVKETDKLQDALSTRDRENAQLEDTLQGRESHIVELNSQIEYVKEKHLFASEAWKLKESEMQSCLKKLERELGDEKARRNKLSGELMLAKQAEAALNGELEHTRNLTAHIEETERENEKLKRINDLIMRKSNMNAIEVERVEKLNTELVSQQNPAQKVRVLDRMRREIKEEKENTAKLENQLWAANSEIKLLKDELSAYQSTSHPKPPSTLNNVMGISRVTRPPLTEVVKPFKIQPTIRPEVEDGSEKQSRSKVTTRHPSDGYPEKLVRPTKALDDAVDTTKPSKLPINQTNYQKVMRKRNDLMKDKPMGTKDNQTNDHAKHAINNEEMSLGAIKMQGKMTLDELR